MSAHIVSAARPTRAAAADGHSGASASARGRGARGSDALLLVGLLARVILGGIIVLAIAYIPTQPLLTLLTSAVMTLVYFLLIKKDRRKAQQRHHDA